MGVTNTEIRRMTPGPFEDLRICADGSERAHQRFQGWQELWVFTGTRCNLACTGCYTESNPRNGSFRFITLDQMERIFEEALELRIPKICYTGGEPFFNPDFPHILDRTLELGFACLVLSNLTRPYEARGRVVVRKHLAAGRSLQIRASLDHPDPAVHEQEELEPEIIVRYPVPSPLDSQRKYWFQAGFYRGRGNFERTLANMAELHSAGCRISVAGRCPSGVGGKLYAGAFIQQTEPLFRSLFEDHGLPEDLPLRIFPDIGIGMHVDVPEVTEQRCRTLIPGAVFQGLMCNSTRMVAVPSTLDGRPNQSPVVFPCTIVPDNSKMILGRNLRESMQRETYLADPRCYRFCINAGASCSET